MFLHFILPCFSSCFQAAVPCSFRAFSNSLVHVEDIKLHLDTICGNFSQQCTSHRKEWIIYWARWWKLGGLRTPIFTCNDVVQTTAVWTAVGHIFDSFAIRRLMVVDREWLASAITLNICRKMCNFNSTKRCKTHFQAENLASYSLTIFRSCGSQETCVSTQCHEYFW